MLKRAGTLASVMIATSVLLVAPASAAADVDRVHDISTVLAVARGADFPVRSLMRAECAFVQRVENPDGSARETMTCDLSSEPVMIPEFQGVPPTTALHYGGGSCEWLSDYWFAVTGTDVYAESYHVVVTPAGKVHATADYPSVPLTCA